MPVYIPQGKMRTKRREFFEVANDLRHAVCSIVRHRPLPSVQQGGAQQFQAFPLGSGFFVAPQLVLTCYHVIAGTPHQPGDFYHFVLSLPNGAGVIHTLGAQAATQSIHLFANDDLALIELPGIQQQAFVAVGYNAVPVGSDIGVAGYPLGLPTVDAQGQLGYDSMIYRVGRGVVTSTYRTNINTEQGQQIPAADVLEVNFLFVAGNSGGPIFDAETGRVVAFVHGFQSPTITERVATARIQLPAGMSAQYVQSIHAIYSMGIKLDRVRQQLESRGVTL